LPAPENAAGAVTPHENSTAREVVMRFRKMLTFFLLSTV
jgi:hypothetical protein